ncbi:peptidase M20/M25/M40 family protein, partial [Chlamydia psittaci 02DC16]
RCHLKNRTDYLRHILCK